MLSGGDRRLRHDRRERRAGGAGGGDRRDRHRPPLAGLRPAGGGGADQPPPGRVLLPLSPPVGCRPGLQARPGGGAGRRPPAGPGGAPADRLPGDDRRPGSSGGGEPGDRRPGPRGTAVHAVAGPPGPPRPGRGEGAALGLRRRVPSRAPDQRRRSPGRRRQGPRPAADPGPGRGRPSGRGPRALEPGAPERGAEGGPRGPGEDVRAGEPAPDTDRLGRGMAPGGGGHRGRPPGPGLLPSRPAAGGGRGGGRGVRPEHPGDRAPRLPGALAGRHAPLRRARSGGGPERLLRPSGVAASELGGVGGRLARGDLHQNPRVRARPGAGGPRRRAPGATLATGTPRPGQPAALLKVGPLRLAGPPRIFGRSERRHLSGVALGPDGARVPLLGWGWGDRVDALAGEFETLGHLELDRYTGRPVLRLVDSRTARPQGSG